MYKLLTILALALPWSVQADTIPLPTTGQALPTVLGGSLRDAHYTVTSPATLTTTTAASAALRAWIPTALDPAWAAAGNWITPHANGRAELPGGVYTFAVRFELPAQAASITGSLYCDDRVEVLLNGQLVATLPHGNGSGYWGHTLSTFQATQFLLAGTNLIEFRVLNTNPGTPVGLAVQSLSATVASVPEPTTLLLLGSGLAGLASLIRRRR